MMTGTQIEQEIARLRELPAAALGARWRALTGKRSPTGISPGLLVRLIAYRVQADAFGDLSSATSRLLKEVGDGRPVPLPERREGPGTILVREWRGIRHSVAVQKEGFSWNGTTYRSLSEVAFAITGTKWSGPRFFGLKQGRQGQTP